ncbi:hypothetical protein Dimus_013864, partial [Dionaea muscipula]
MARSSSTNHTSKRRMARSDEKPCDLCNRPHHGMLLRKRRDSSRGSTRQDHTTSLVCNRRIGRSSFLASRSRKTPARRSERTTDKWFEDSVLDRRSTQTPDRRSEASQARMDAKDKSHIQCFVCDQYGHYSTQCNQNPKARKYLHRGNHSEQQTLTTTEGGEHKDPTPMGHMVDATITERDGQEDLTPMAIFRDQTVLKKDRNKDPETPYPYYLPVHHGSSLGGITSPTNR